MKMRFIICIIIFLFITTGDCYNDNSSCQDDASPLYLTSYMRAHGPVRARERSRVDRDRYLENFVPPSYAGLITVNETLENNLFFWYFPSHTTHLAPLLLWLDGGPGYSSMRGLFYENGPMEIDQTSSGQNVRYSKREYSWVGTFSMLYVDNPVHVGYSTSLKGEQGDRYTEEGYTQDLYNFLIQFFQLFPEQRNSKFYMGGTSYAGMYVTSLAHYIHIIPGGAIPLTGIYLGGPYFDPETVISARCEFVYNVGAYSYQQMNQNKEYVRNFFANKAPSVTENTTIRNYHYSKLVRTLFLDNFISQEWTLDGKIDHLMNSFNIRRAVHMGDNVFKNWFNDDHSFDRFQNKFLADKLKSRSDKMAVLLDNYKVLIFNGNLDSKVPTGAIDEAIMRTPWSLQETYQNVSRTPIVNFFFDNKTLGYYYSRVGNLCRVVINGAGHLTARDQPKATLQMMGQFVYFGCTV